MGMTDIEFLIESGTKIDDVVNNSVGSFLGERPSDLLIPWMVMEMALHFLDGNHSFVLLLAYNPMRAHLSSGQPLLVIDGIDP